MHVSRGSQCSRCTSRSSSRARNLGPARALNDLDSPVGQFAKRLLDVLIAGAGLALTSPLLLIAVCAIRLESPGPAIFRQVRVGRHSVQFTLYKLRGLYDDACTRYPELYDYDLSDTDLSGFRFHRKSDPRVTRVGRVLRRSSIDELPNLWNVLKGDLSLVGPRPEIPEMLRHYGAAGDIVLSVKPGVVSPAKVSGRDRLTFIETLACDVEYVQNRSFWLDVKVILRTPIAFIRYGGM
jgi:lipopolysaccharide/colanic/teichoic acid biosynthesis glycosyltransferase